MRWFYGQGWCQDRYMAKLADYRGRLVEIPFDFHELLGTLAPRPIFVNAPLHDRNFQASSVDECVAAALPVYRLFNAKHNLTVRHPDCGHDFPQPIREEAYATLDAVLRTRDRSAEDS